MTDAGSANVSTENVAIATVRNAILSISATLLNNVGGSGRDGCFALIDGGSSGFNTLLGGYRTAQETFIQLKGHEH